MTDIHAWPAIVKLLFLVVPFLISMVGVAVIAYTTLSRDYHVVCSAITSDPHVEALKVTWGASTIKWRMLLICAIGWLFVFPKLALRRGQLSADELNEFPPNLRRRLVVSLWLTAIGFVGMAIFTLLLELSKQ
ncbi:hypothetical protein [Pseudomonas putida]|uniref:hypothetical protein n=1 Tax=Pseudomonas putida TaxID=303 RepID=UPI0021F846E3|nr:hypothetical protein [Pseudomonas putida]